MIYSMMTEFILKITSHSNSALNIEYVIDLFINILLKIF